MAVESVCRRQSVLGWAACAGMWLAGASGALAAPAPIGFASLNGGTTGGAGGPTVTATTAAQFQTYATQDGPLTIRVAGTLNVGGVKVASDKTIVGVGESGALIGSMQLSEVSNVILRNLSISNPNDAGEGDAITLRESTNVWIDHNDIFDAPDGLLDIVRASDNVTVSWNDFHYTSAYASNENTSHRFAMLIGNSDNATEDIGKLHVTLHHNNWGPLVRERMPRARYGDIHVFNSYFNTPGDNYAIRSAVGAELLVENNSFENVRSPYVKYSTSAGIGEIEASGNLLVNTSGPIDPGTDDVFPPPYDYVLIDAADVKDRVLRYAGVLALFGDYDADDAVTGADFLAWQAGDSAYALSAVDLADWQDNLGATAAAQAISSLAAPEPATWALAALAAALGCLRAAQRTTA
ncbi:MAG: pectate lyase [Planctomycetaceae bacterium]|nr:pectate lyase [Planctomycetaceae bacterium]